MTAFGIDTISRTAPISLIQSQTRKKFIIWQSTTRKVQYPALTLNNSEPMKQYISNNSQCRRLGLHPTFDLICPANLSKIVGALNVAI
jgi:hypothetical protein